MPPTERTKRLHMLLSDDEERMLQELADADGLTASDVVRLLVRREHGTRFPPRRPISAGASIRYHNPSQHPKKKTLP